MEPERLKEMLNLIDDKEKSISKFIFEKMGQSRDESIEKFLVSYISKNTSGKIDQDKLLKCFSVLGLCGSSYSVPFLSEPLMKWGFIPGSRRSLLRRGAAISLFKLKIDQVDQVLERAGKSIFPGMRKVIKKVRQELLEEADSNA